jgi:hypothetical protein
MGITPPGRIVNLAFVSFVLGWIYFLLHLSSYLQDIMQSSSFFTRKAVSQILLLIGIVVIIASFSMPALRNSNYFIIAKSISKHIPQKFSAAMDHRYQLITGSKSDTVALPAIPKEDLPVNLLHWADLRTNPNALPNTYIAIYWGKAQMYIRADSTLRGH